MVEVVIKKRKTLSLSRTSAPCSKEKLIPKKVSKHEKINKCKSWLKASWPDLFNPNEVKPLKLGISKDIQNQYDIDGGADVLGFGRSLHITKALHLWTNHKKYLKALCEKDAVRYGIDGLVSDVVSQEHAQNAHDVLMSRLEAKER